MIELVHDEGFMLMRVSGRLRHEDYNQLVPEFERELETHDHLKVLIELDDFKGWTPRGLIDELEFDLRHRDEFEKVAVVGERSLEEFGTKITRPFFDGDVRYFDSKQRSEARDWLKS